MFYAQQPSVCSTQSGVASVPYRRTLSRGKPKLGPFLTWIHEVLAADRNEPRKQRHTTQRIFALLRTERGYTGGVSVVKDEVRAWKQTRREVFIPLSHPPCEAHVDFGFAHVDLASKRCQVA